MRVRARVRVRVSITLTLTLTSLTLTLTLPLPLTSKGGVPLGEVAQGECFGEMSLLAPEPTKTKQFTLTCASDACSVVTVAGADFRRLLEKSRVVNRSMHAIADRRRQHNAASEKSTQNKGAADKT